MITCWVTPRIRPIVFDKQFCIKVGGGEDFASRTHRKAKIFDTIEIITRTSEPLKKETNREKKI